MFPEPAVDALRDRAAMLKASREFFALRGILEVDCCALSPYAAIDSHIDVMEAAVSDTRSGYLHTSPEYAMKRLLSDGIGDVYFLGHVFRKGDIGRLHNPEFTMAEWYRTGISLSQMVEEACEFLFLFFGSLPVRVISYREAFLRYTGLDYSSAPIDLLRAAASHLSAHGIASWDRDSCVHFLLTHAIEPYLGRGELIILTDYPPHEAALACVIQKNGEPVAERFEIYYEGVELANGYHELRDFPELRQRFEKENDLRKSRNKKAYPLDEAFLSAMQKGLPPCCGVSVGFDRAIMIRQKAESIGNVLPFCWPKTNF